MSKTDLAYIAGFFDGEGCISIKRIRNRNRPFNQYQLEVTVGSTDEWVCERFKFVFGGNVRKTKSRNPNWKPFWVWRASSKTAGVFLKVIIPYLHLKRDRAEIALTFQRARSIKQDRRSLTSEEMALEEAQRILMQSLNKRGVKEQNYV